VTTLTCNLATPLDGAGSVTVPYSVFHALVVLR